MGIEIISGARPFIYAVLDPDLNVKVLERYSVSKVMRCLQGNENVMLAINVSFRNGNGHKVFNTLEQEIARTGFRPYLSNHACRQWVETYPLECFSALTEQTLLPSRSIRGRVQRASILYEQGVQINNPGESLEGRYHLNAAVSRATPYSPSELDALIAASIGWMLVNRPVNIDLTRDPDRKMISIPRDDKNWRRKKPIVRD